MKRILHLEQGIIGGDTVRDILRVFPEIENRFRQRKTYDEYYFDEATVELTIDIIGSLNQLGFKVSINWQYVILS
jgi:hypothetical protein